MTQVAQLTFNPFQENTFVVYDESQECVIIDPGCYTEAEREALVSFINEKKLRPVRLLNTHCHLDHVFGNAFVAKTYDLDLEMHKADLPILQNLSTTAHLYNIPNVQPSPEPKVFHEEGDTISFGQTTFQVLFTPGHSPGSISFYCKEEHFVIAGDVLFERSIGRTDLPGGDMNTLLSSIRQKLLPLKDETLVYNGHGRPTTIGAERRENPFLH